MALLGAYSVSASGSLSAITRRSKTSGHEHMLPSSASASSAPNTSVAPSLTCRLQAVIWVGSMSRTFARSASVFSPLITARATFASKPSLWVRRAYLMFLTKDIALAQHKTS